jgi:hypothetical protein
MPWLEECLILFEGNTEIRRYEPRVAEGGSLQMGGRKSLKRGSNGVVHNTLVVRQHYWKSHARNCTDRVKNNLSRSPK